MTDSTQDKVTDRSLEDTGERMIPAYHKGNLVYGEHLARYRAAAELVVGKRVLDIAAGSGYGSAMLGKTAEDVVGVEIDPKAVKYAKDNYASENVSFVQGSGTEIPLENASVDVVVSFETLEHIEESQKFIEEVKRVLKRDGLFILSTPNDAEFSEGNHFHVHEFEYSELESQVKKYFSNIKPFFQGTWLYTEILDENQLKSEWDAERKVVYTAPIERAKSLYFFLLCANRSIDETINSEGIVSQHYSARSIQDYENSVRKHIDDQGVIIGHQAREIQSLNNAISVADRQLTAKQLMNLLVKKLVKKFSP